MSNLIGQTLGPYRIIEQIGIGGMATVYKAYQPSMDRYVAIKVLPALVSRDPAFLKRFRREAKVVAKLEHKHILPVHDYGEQEGLTYLVMRYVEAGTLKDRLAAGQLDLPAIYRIIAQMGAALDYAHRLGVIHRDVKPSNVLIDSQGDAYLTDFGLARIMESSEQLTKTGVGVGTPDYMAPEQGQGLKIDHRSDIYSLGVMLYEMVTGQVPYQAETPIAVVLKHITAPLPLPSSVKPGIPQQVERVILKALAKNPDDRFQTAREMVEALDLAVRAAAAAPAAAQVERGVLVPVSAAPAKLRWPWDVRTTALGVGIAALALLVIGGMFFALSRIQYRVQVVGGRVEVVSVSTEAATPTPAVALVETPTSEAMLAATATPQPTTAPTVEYTPPATPVPTATPQPTPTGCSAQSQAGATLEAVQETTAALVPGAKIIWYDGFECSDLDYGWDTQRSGLGTMMRVSNGMVRISAQKADDVWDGIYRAARNVQDGRGVLVLFRYEAGTVAPAYIESGQWQTPSYRSWGLMITEDVTDPYYDLGTWRWEGRESTQWIGEPLDISLRAGEWYYLLIKLGQNGELITRVWERNDPNRQTELRKVRNANWVGLQWRFFIQVHTGAVEIDEYQEIEFASP